MKHVQFQPDPKRPAPYLIAGLVAVLVFFAWCGGRSPLTPTASGGGGAPQAGTGPSSAPSEAIKNAAAPDVVFVGAGDLGNCPSHNTDTARLLDGISGSVFTLGDNVYPNGSAEQYAKCYEPTWGRHRARTYPTLGNHDWEVNSGAPYFAYFGAAAGPAGLGYYSYDLGAWHILSLNSNISSLAGSPQYRWAQQDLAANGALCSLAYWHHPLFSSGSYGNIAEMKDLWRMLDNAGVDVVLGGHNHMYERFGRQDADARPTPLGIREFVVGTGGEELSEPRAIQINSEVRESHAWGVLKLTLRPEDYSWEFVPVEGQLFRDSGTTDCR